MKFLTKHQEDLRNFFDILKSNPEFLNKDFEAVYEVIYWYKGSGGTVRSPQAAKRRIEFEKRSLEMKKKYESGFSLKNVGMFYKITGERVRQILEKNFPEMEIRFGRKKEKSIYEKECKECKIKFLSYFKFAKFCSKKCSNVGRIKYKTAEDWKERNRLAAKKHYHEIVKKDPIKYQLFLKKNREYQKRMRSEGNIKKISN